MPKVIQEKGSGYPGEDTTRNSKEPSEGSGGIDPWRSEDVPEQVEPHDAESLSYEWSTDEGLEGLGSEVE